MGKNDMCVLLSYLKDFWMSAVAMQRLALNYELIQLKILYIIFVKNDKNFKLNNGNINSLI